MLPVTMPRISLVLEAQKYIANHLMPGDIAIDATVGNGFDTLFLARQVGSSGKVYGFDIQPQALQTARKKLIEKGLSRQVELILACHAQSRAHIDKPHIGKITAVMFNLGYLPGADKTRITQTRTTLAALQIHLGLLSEKGMMSIIAYPGHQGGDEETEAVMHWSRQHDKALYKLSHVSPAGTQKKAPHLFIIQRRTP